MQNKYSLFIGGRWIESSQQERFPAINPYTQEEWASIPQASEEQVADAIVAARKAFGTWRKTSGLERGRLLNKLADLLADDAERMGNLESTDNGKIIRETRHQMTFCARQYRFHAGFADKLWGKSIPLDQRDVLDYTVREPLGVVVLVTAWNSPMVLLSNKLAPALAAGNCVVIKPSEHASASTLEFARMVEMAGFPAGVVNVVTGDARVGKALLNSGRINRVSFTGSPGVGAEIAANAGRNLVPVTLELGGKSPNIIFDDADLPKAVNGALAGIFAATGQTCIAGSRLLVQRPVYAEVVDKLVERAKKIKLGNPVDKATEMGTVANEPQFRRILQMIDKAKGEGASLAAGGGRAGGAELAKGLFVEPTIFVDVQNDMSIAQEEVFGPVLSIIPFDTEEEAIEISNTTRFGLAAGVWTTNISRALRVSREIDTGVVWINTYRVSAAQAPFGGVKDSGFGRERGDVALDEFTSVKNIMVDFSNADRDPFAV
ncbi:aldehyde dehydrogenase (NAD+) [Rhizobium sp. PP-F2F-G48]|uniref:aldehyde dehydrogenase n=1 Tax=Rhizobium sp. PP-F2F-G48 TaxID=2135651 RepID=UPI0010446FE4|nr:aldehyde dehydrogenase [Rhizobium sp. PP-F2F-G48]TCM47189.1 aldehyde dehydrogenase (NAD+) [Rhizobium sp. PP-F2F-G48]